MAERSKKIDKTDAIGTGTSVVEAKSAKGGALSTLSRQISDVDLKNKAVVRLILDRNDQLQREVDELSAYKDKFHEKDKLAAVLLEKLKSMNARYLAIAMGGILAGYLPSLWDSKGEFLTAALLSVILLLVGFLGNPWSKDNKND
jgi:hypothetical protein